MKQAAQTGDPRAKIAYGRMLERGLDWAVKHDCATAFKWYESAANDGLAEGLYWMGWLYKNGNGVPTDRRKACDLWEQAGDGGYLQGYMAAGVEMRGRLGGSYADPPRARKALEKGARKGEASCMNLLGEMLAEGEGGRKDLKAAKEWFLKAKAAGHPLADDSLKEYFG